MKALIVDDDPIERAHTAEALRAAFADIEIDEVSAREEFESRLARADFHLVITEYCLGWSDGLNVIRRLKTRFHCVPVIMLTGSGSEDVAVAAMKAGAVDYLPKFDQVRLIEAVGRCLSIAALCEHCEDKEHNVLMCERWDLAISRLTSDFAYSVRVAPDGNLECEWVTEPFTRITGYPTRELACPNGWLVPIYPDDRPIFRHWLDTLRAGRQEMCEYRIIASNGDILWLRDHALPVRDWAEGRVVRIYGAAQDVTARRSVEHDLRIKQRALECSNNGILITGVADTDYGIVYANPAFQRMTGYSREELLGRNPRFLQGEDRAQPGLATLHMALDAGNEGYAVLRNYRKDGSLFWNEVYIAPVRDDGGRITHYVGVQNDVTERKRAEESMRELWRHLQSAREEERARIAREIHDELGSLLAILKLDLNWLVKRLPSAPEGVRDKLADMSRRLDSGVHSVRTITAELRPSVLDTLGLLPAIEWQVRDFREHTGLECTLLLPPTEHIPIGDEQATAVFRILQESLTNIARHAQASLVQIEVNIKEGELIMRITDNGIGIPQQLQTQPPSWGLLGMSERARDFGGELSITGGPSQGTTVILRMPLVDAKAR